jgi:hypothetical protein
VATLRIDADSVTLHLTGAEKAESLHGDLTYPRKAIAGVRVVSSGLDEVDGFKLFGAGVPGVMKVGMFRSERGSTFAACHGNGPAIVIDLVGEHYDRIVATLDDPERAASELL